jgi:hypothetical protein
VSAYHAQINRMDDVDIDDVDDVPGEAEVFSGDHFADYQDDGLEWPEEGQAEGLGANASTIMHNCDLRCAPGFDDGFDESDEEHEQYDVVRPASSVPVAESPFEIEQFPSRTAGAPILGSERGPSSFEAYQRTFGGNN